MKSTLNNSGSSKTPMYPRLMIDDEYGMVVLFETSESGTCLYTGNANNEEVGNHEAYDSTDDDWSDYTGTITLEN
jgi:hypothetical protein